MAEKSPSKLTPEAEKERGRVIALLEMHQEALEQVRLWPRLLNMIRSGDDPRDQDYGDDRLPGF